MFSSVYDLKLIYYKKILHYYIPQVDLKGFEVNFIFYQEVRFSQSNIAKNANP